MSLVRQKAPYTGQIKGKLRHGYGTYVYPGGFFKYTGDWVAGEKHGQGVFEMGDGSSYDGDFVYGEMTGIGLRKWPNGSSFNGHFENGEMHGEGIFISASGERYDGNFKCNKRDGEGELVAEGKYVYVGGFKFHKKHGQGRLSNQEGVSYTYEGGFDSGMRSGDGSYEDANGNSYVGQWAEDKRHGRGVDVNVESGVTYTGNWESNVPIQVPTRIRASKVAPPAEEGEEAPPAQEEEEAVEDPTKIPAKFQINAGDELPAFKLELVKQPDGWVEPEPAPVIEAEPEEDDKKKKKGKKGKKKDDDDEDEVAAPEFEETNWSVVEWESGRLLRCQLFCVIPPEEEPEEGGPPVEPQREACQVLVPKEPDPEVPAEEGVEVAVAEGEGEEAAEAAEAEEAEAGEATAETAGGEGGEEAVVAEEEAPPMEEVPYVEARSEAGIAIIPRITIPNETKGGMYELIFSDVTATDLVEVPALTVKLSMLGFGEEEDPKKKKKKK